MHSLLKAALNAAPAELLPPTTNAFHNGVDANPQLGAFGCAGAAIFLAEMCADRVDPPDQKRFDHWLGEAKRIYGLHARAEGKEVTKYTKSKLVVLTTKDELKELSAEVCVDTDRGRALRVPLRAANAALYAALDIEVQGGGPYVLSVLKLIVDEVTREMPREKMSSFITAFDRVLTREELRAMLAQRRDPRCEKITECLWRFGGSAKARQGRASGVKITHWIGRLDDKKTFLLLWKVGARWQVLTGDRDEILASVPDEQMESAVATILK